MVEVRSSSPWGESTTWSTIGWQLASWTQRTWRMAPAGADEPMKTAAASAAHFRMNGTPADGTPRSKRPAQFMTTGRVAGVRPLCRSAGAQQPGQAGRQVVELLGRALVAAAGPADRVVDVVTDRIAQQIVTPAAFMQA